MRAGAPRLVALAASAWALPGLLSTAEGPPSPPSSPVMSSLPRATDRLRSKLPHRPGAAEYPRARSTSPPADATSPEGQPNNANLHDMVPITRELLSKHYTKFPNPQISDELRVQRGEIAKLQEAVLAGEASLAAKKVRDEVDAILAEELPKGLDSSMYKARCACEEAAGSVSSVPELADLAPTLDASAARFEAFQRKQREHVHSVIDQFLPQDFRGSLFTAAKQSSEKRNAQAMDELMTNGGSIRDKYKLLWEQQWRRRENLAMVGNATGVWKWLVRYLAGVPQPLLMFAKNINATDGPTDALRAKFGSSLKELSLFAIELNALCTAVALAGNKNNHAEVKIQVAKSLTLYETEVGKFVDLLQEVIVNSPFFIQPEQIEAAKSTKA